MLVSLLVDPGLLLGGARNGSYPVLTAMSTNSRETVMLGKSVLCISALLFTGYGLVSVISPEIPAGFAGIEMPTGDAYAEIGAMYGGLQTGIGLFCLLALLRSDFYRSGLELLALGIGLLAIARVYSALSAPAAVSLYSIGAIGYEFATAVLAAVALRYDILQQQSKSR